MIEIEIQNDQITSGLETLQQRLGDLSPATRAITEVLKDATEANFAAQGRPGWQQLARSTQKARARTGHWPGPILQVSGALARSVETRYSPVMAAIGTNLVYAAIQQLGGTVQHAARSQQAYFKHDAKTGQVGNRFVPKKQSNFAQWVTIGAHTSRIPARPFLPVTATGELQPGVVPEVMAAISYNLSKSV